jgi:hypothetical protein
MTITKYIGMDVHKESISIAVMNAAGKLVMECVIETKGSMLLQFIDGLRGDVHVTFEEGTWAAWLAEIPFSPWEIIPSGGPSGSRDARFRGEVSIGQLGPCFTHASLHCHPMPPRTIE